jgi:phenylacetate-CoA ligase
MYGSIECTWIASQCRARDLLHIPEERVIVEVTAIGDPNRSAEPGALGEIVVTDLFRTTMPFIRYRLLDLVRRDDSPCSCGWDGPSLKEVEGRTMNLFISPKGEWIAPVRLQLPIEDLKLAEDYRIIQEAPDHIRVEVIPGTAFSEAGKKKIIEVIQKCMGPSVKVAIDQVETIPLSSSGKRHRIIRCFDAPGVPGVGALQPRMDHRAPVES